MEDLNIEEFKGFVVRLTWPDGSCGWYSGSGTRTTKSLIKAKIYPTINLAKQSNPSRYKKIYSVQHEVYETMQIEYIPIIIKTEVEKE